ncbi:glycosyltransferase family A protein [Trichocoleus sp. FACHB-262]|uniref:glycosyltransferase family 2 protein n=1 Tax=Trichocoleus sp. FACHB-262 TaxID=2692869 RepID=UPI001684E211|nr:glycosyltransferase family A protein [Trichocoleus sp. FACHB-262]MBD2122026.1 glycosyltransferase family 2 protein [Trichocoleus sp. FACHB-262]
MRQPVPPKAISHPFLSIVVPVYNGGEAFRACLSAIRRSHFQNWELIVVDDGSSDRSAQVASEFGATVLSTHKPQSGPGFARNVGAQVAKGQYLCFIDADCEVNSQTFSHLAEVLRRDLTLDAVFGSYDDAPKATNFVAQYKNLLHHYTHQTGCEDASTFWAGCGAVKRSTFLALGGFDTQRYPRPSIEDIDLGYRIKQAGGKILLAKQVQVKHHKAWKLNSLIKTDLFDRGIPWTQLLLDSRSGMANDLNLQVSSRLSVVAVYLLLLLGLSSFYSPQAVWGLLLAAIALLILNQDVYRFFRQKRDLSFTLKAILMHWLYYIYSGLAFLIGNYLHWQEQLGKDRAVTKTLFDH